MHRPFLFKPRTWFKEIETAIPDQAAANSLSMADQAKVISKQQKDKQGN